MFHAIFKTKGIFNSNRLSPPPFNLIKLDSLKKPLHKAHLMVSKGYDLYNLLYKEHKLFLNLKLYKTKNIIAQSQRA